MDLIQLCIRVLGFAVTFYLLLEFCIVCDVTTWKAIATVLGTMLIVGIFFVLTKRYETTMCPACKQLIPPKMNDKNSKVMSFLSYL
jgi:hypothetical protein